MVFTKDAIFEKKNEQPLCWMEAMCVLFVVSYTWQFFFVK